MICTSCGHKHRGYVYGFDCGSAGCICRAEPGRAEWAAELEAKMPAPTAAGRRAFLRKMVELCDDAAHWNRAHPDEAPIVIDTDIRKDVAKLKARTVKGGTA